MSTPSQPYPYAYFKTEVVPIAEAQISIMSKVVQYGLGWFGGIRGYISADKTELHLFRLDDHLTRFLQSAAILGVSIPYSHAELKDIIVDLTAHNHPKVDTYFRPFAFSDSTDLSPSLIQNPVFAFALYMMPLGDYLPTTTGNAVCVSSWRRPSDNAIPSRAKISGAYVNSALAKQEAVKNGFAEAIMLDEQGQVTEGTAMNLFVVRNGTLITPAASSDILEGITRRTVFQIAHDLGIPTQERAVDRSELYVADEAFFCGTGAQIAWIDSIDRRAIGSGVMGPITRRISDVFYATIHGTHDAYRHWLTSVPV